MRDTRRAVALLSVLTVGCGKGHSSPSRTADGGPPHETTRGSIYYGPIDGNWRTFAVPGEPLTVDFPGEPRERKMQILLPGSPIADDCLDSRTYAVGEYASHAFLVRVDRWPTRVRPPPDVPRGSLLRKDADDCVADSPAKVVDIHRIDLGGVPGMDIQAVTNSGGRHHIRAFRVGDTTYCVTATTDAHTETDEMDRFISSIRFAQPEMP